MKMKKLMILVLLLVVGCAQTTHDSPLDSAMISPIDTYLPLVSHNPGGIDVYDCSGQQADIDWLTETFGPVSVVGGPGATLQVLRCGTGPAVLVAHVEASGPAEGVTVVRYWPGAPSLPPELCNGGLCQGVYGPTNANGDIGFGLGAGDYYFPPEAGASCMWLIDSDLLCGLGMIGGTNHQHLDSGWSTTSMADRVEWGFGPRGVIVRSMTVNDREMLVIEVPEAFK